MGYYEEAIDPDTFRFENISICLQATKILGLDAAKQIEARGLRYWDRQLNLNDFPGWFFNLALVEYTKYSKGYDVSPYPGGSFSGELHHSWSIKDKSMYDFYKCIDELKEIGLTEKLKSRIAYMENDISYILSEFEYVLDILDLEIRRNKNGIRNRIYVLYSDCTSYPGLFSSTISLIEYYKTYSVELLKEKEQLMTSIQIQKEDEINEYSKAC